MPALDPRTHLLSGMMDRRVKPGNDEIVYVGVASGISAKSE
jgi:hypothetical protein